MTRLSAAWMQDPATTTVMSALCVHADDARFVGGVVRDTLLNKPITDVDIATKHTPERVMQLLTAHGIRHIPTGLKHGTVTAVVNKRHFEITTLRHDVATDGRHAEVAFTTSYEEDAARRDFTFNAMSLSHTGELFDYFGGQADLQAGVVRFVGDASARVKEDYLRILRFFRFHAWYGKTAPDNDALAACVEGAHGIRGLSGERIHNEMFRLLEAEDPSRALEAMAQFNVLPQVLPGFNGYVLMVLNTLRVLERQMAAPIDPILRLAAIITPSLVNSLLPEIQDVLSLVAERWKLSNVERSQLFSLITPKTAFSPRDELSMKKALRELGTEDFIRLAALVAALGMTMGEAHIGLSLEGFTAAQTLVANWTPPEFPLKGEDILGLGVPAGKEVGRILKTAEAAWEDSDYILTKTQLLSLVIKFQ